MPTLLKFFLCGTALDVKGVHVIGQNSQLDAGKFCMCRSSALYSVCVPLTHRQQLSALLTNGGGALFAASRLVSLMHGIRTTGIISRGFFCYREAASWTQFDGVLLRIFAIRKTSFTSRVPSVKKS
jgi:hypothetical protein